MAAMPRPNKQSKQIAYKILGVPPSLTDEEKPKKKTTLDTNYEEIKSNQV